MKVKPLKWNEDPALQRYQASPYPGVVFWATGAGEWGQTGSEVVNYTEATIEDAIQGAEDAWGRFILSEIREAPPVLIDDKDVRGDVENRHMTIQAESISIYF